MAIDTLGTNSLGANSVRSAKIADGTIATADIADNAVTDAKFGGSGAVAYFVNSSGTAIGDTSSSGLNALMRVNNQTLSGNVTITGTQNASMAGPVTIANGVTLTVQSGGRFVAI